MLPTALTKKLKVTLEKLTFPVSPILLGQSNPVSCSRLSSEVEWHSLKFYGYLN